MFRFRSYIILAVALVMCISLGGCGKKRAVGTEGTPDNPWIIGMSQCNLGEPWRVQMNADIRAAAAKHPELQVQFKDAQNQTPVQQDQVREFVRQGVDLIIVSPKEARPLTRPVGEAIDARIPVIVLDRKIEGEKYTCFIGGDNVLIGREAGKYLVKLVPFDSVIRSSPASDARAFAGFQPVSGP